MIKISSTNLSERERKTRKREVIVIVVVLILVPLLTFIGSKAVHFGTDVPVSNTILLFILININLLLLVLLIYLTFKNLVKLFYERRRKVLGSKLRIKLVLAFTTLTLLPTTILFFFSINFITASIKFWFNAPVDQALENSLRVGRKIYEFAEEDNQYFLERIAYQIKKKNFLLPENRNALSRYIRIVQVEFNFHAVEIYDGNAYRLTFALSSDFENQPLAAIATDNFRTKMTTNHTITRAVNQGELVRTIGTVPYGVRPIEASGFVVLNQLIPKELAANMESIVRGFEEYQQIKLLKEPVKVTYYMTLSIVALLVLFTAIWFGFYFAKSITVPLLNLAEGTRQVAEGNLNFSIDAIPDDEIGSLVESFNQMTQDLRHNRKQLEFSALKLRDQNIEIEERRQYMEIVLKNVSTGVISMDANGIILTINKAAEKMLQIQAHNILNRQYDLVLKGKYLKLAQQILMRLFQFNEDEVIQSARIKVRDILKSFLIHANALRDDTGNNVGVVVVLDDLTELEKAQRVAAWREVARRVAHEVKNPLTPITLSAQRLKRKYSKIVNEPVFDECTRMIIDHVELIRNLVNEFSAYARFPAAQPQQCNLNNIIEETIALYREGHENILFTVDLDDSMPYVSLDRQHLKQALINLVDNAVSAIQSQGNIELRTKYDSTAKLIRIEIIDDGPGIAEPARQRLFEPNFSTKKTGSGIGLTIVNSIITDHDGKIHAMKNEPQGARFIIELPAKI